MKAPHWIAALILFTMIVSVGLKLMLFPGPAPAVAHRGPPDRWVPPSEPTFLPGNWHGRVTDEGILVVRGWVRNETAHLWRDLLVSVPCYNTAGHLIGVATSQMPELPPGGSWYYRATAPPLIGADHTGRPLLFHD